LLIVAEQTSDAGVRAQVSTGIAEVCWESHPEDCGDEDEAAVRELRDRVFDDRSVHCYHPSCCCRWWWWFNSASLLSSTLPGLLTPRSRPNARING